MATNDEHERDTKMFGCTKEEIRAAIKAHFRETAWPRLKLALSILSDAQELLDHGRNEEVRQHINRAKYVIQNEIDTIPF
jgi:hypothetical protein